MVNNGYISGIGSSDINYRSQQLLNIYDNAMSRKSMLLNIVEVILLIDRSHFLPAKSQPEKVRSLVSNRCL